MRFHRATRRLAVATLLCFAVAASADTTISSNVTSSTTWSAGASPYIVTAHISVSPGVTLTIEPGTVVKFNDGFTLDINGRLSAVGTASQPITFTSSRTTPSAGSWGGIQFGSDSDPASQLAEAVVAYSGSFWYQSAAIRINGSRPALTNVTVSDSSTVGIRVFSSASPTITGCTVTRSGSYGISVEGNSTVMLTNTTICDNAGYAIGTEAGSALNGLTGMTATGNGAGAKNAIEHRGGTMWGPETWRSTGGALPWDVTSNIAVVPAASLTIEPGVTVRFADLRAIDVSGRLTAVGTPGQRITFTTNRAVPVRGAWSKIQIGPGSASDSSRIAYADIKYGGAYAQGQLIIDGSSASLDHVTIAESSSAGVYLQSGGRTGLSPVLSNCSFSANAGHAVNANDLTIDARLSYWNSDSGPRGAGPGTGESISSGVLFEPWLVAAAVFARTARTARRTRTRTSTTAGRIRPRSATRRRTRPCTRTTRPA